MGMLEWERIALDGNAWIGMVLLGWDCIALDENTVLEWCYVALDGNAWIGMALYCIAGVGFHCIGWECSTWMRLHWITPDCIALDGTE